MNHKLHIYENAESASRAVAELIKDEAVLKESESEKLNIAISGGSTPKFLFTLLAEEYEKSIPWKSVRLFWVDERCVEPSHIESNFGMTYDALLRKSVIPAQNIFRMKGEDFPEDEAERYSKLLWKELPVRNGFPVFDIILLGMGDDGHTASIFPNDMTLMSADISVGVGVHPVSGQKRITLTGKTICNAEQTVFLITGENKAPVLKQIIKNEPSALNYPAAYIHDNKGNVDFYLDKLAAKDI
ncbi:MAG: 6-phosphogluconolactonase [Paludibacter sp.]